MNDQSDRDGDNLVVEDKLIWSEADERVIIHDVIIYEP